MVKKPMGKVSLRPPSDRVAPPQSSSVRQRQDSRPTVATFAIWLSSSVEKWCTRQRRRRLNCRIRSSLLPTLTPKNRPALASQDIADDRRGAPSMILHPPPRPSPRDGPCKPRPGPAKHPTIDGAVVNGRREAGRLGGLGKMGALWVLPAQSTRQLQRGKDAVERPLERSAWLNSWTSTLEQLPALSSSLWTYAPILCA